jgi:hypothetical protein
MRTSAMPGRLRLSAAGAALLVLAGCASVNIEQAVQQTNDAAPGFTQGKLALSRTAQQRQACNWRWPTVRRCRR